MDDSNSQLDKHMNSAASAISYLSESERLQLLIDSITEYAICMLDAEGLITSWNSGAGKITGYNSEEVLGRHFSSFFTENDRSEGVPEEILREADHNGRSRTEGWRVRKDGSQFFASSVVHPMRDASGSLIGFASIMRDMTERLLAQEALLDSERRFRLLVEGVVDYAIYMLDPSGLITNWNLGAQRLKGYESGEIVGQHFSRFYTREDRMAGLPWRVLEAAASEGRYESEGWRVRKDGSRFWASVVVDAIRDENGQLIGFAKITRDITERKKAQEELRESERQFRMLVEGVTDYALYMLDPNGIVISWNAGAERIKGYTASEIIGQHFSRFYSERDKAAGVPARALQVAVNEGRFEAEGWRVRKNGEIFWANVIVDPVRDEEGNVVGFAKVTQDITAKRDAQMQLQKAQEQRDRAQRMEALGHLTGGVAHDFNNLLMVINGFTQTIEKMVADNPRGVRATEAIRLAVERGQSLTRQLLTFSGRQTLNPVATEIGERIEAFSKMIEGSLGPSIKLTSHVAADIWPVKIDASELELALLNIAINARDAMPEGGVITITAENVELKREQTQAQLEGEFVALTITDTGTGIAEEILPKVFDPFFSTKGSGKGTGLGLSQVHGFAHQSGGTVTIDSNLGRGTRVTLYVPRAADAPGLVAQEPADLVQGEGLALLVDDNLDVLEVSSLYLQELGYQVHAVDNARAALKAAEDEAYSLVVSDIVMPGGMDGIDLAQEIRKRRPDMPIVLVTGYSEIAATIGNAFVLLRKPYKLDDLSRSVTSAIASASPQPQESNLVHLNKVAKLRQRLDNKPKGP